MGARDVARAAGASAVTLDGADGGRERLGVPAHAEIIVGTPDGHLARGLGGILGSPKRDRKPHCVALQIRKRSVAVLGLETRDGALEVLGVIRPGHPYSPISTRSVTIHSSTI